MTIDAVLAARSVILERSGAIAQTTSPSAPGGFGAVLSSAMNGVQKSQEAAGVAAAAFERGDTNDIAAVQLARQAAGIEFQATLQVRNRVLGAYRDIMNMTV